MKCSSSSSSTSPSLGFLGVKKAVAHVFVAAMSCIFSCFRVKDTSSPSNLKNSTPEETVVNRNRSPLSSLFISEENTSNSKEEKGLEEQDLYFEELKKQAKFLKACGTIPETPAEIKIVEAEKDNFSSQGGTVETLKFKSWLTYTSIEKLDLESQPDQLPKLNKDTKEWVEADVSQEHSPSSSCVTNDRNSERLSPNSIEGNVVRDAVSSELLSTLDHSSAHSSISNSMTGPNIPCKNKSVRFDCELDMHSASSKGYSSETPIPALSESRAADRYSNVKPSPYPTPLKLSDEMQTPGTVFPAYTDDIGQGKYPRIRTQYVTHYAAKPGESLSPVKTLDGDSCSDQPNHCQEPFEKVHESEEAKTGEISMVKDLIPDASKSPLPDTKSPSQDVSSAAKAHRVKNPGDRPIIGLVAAHWNDTEPSRVSPKWWDGNGIPNSTNKYQEDQKVSWHATPFEERLEKALSEESLISQRKQSTGSSTPINFGETEESDTAMSQLQSSTHFKPVVSC